MVLLKIGFCFLGGGLLFPIHALASCIGIGCNCTASASSMNFGIYNPTSNTPVGVNGNVQVTCSVLVVGLTVSYTVDFNAGNSGSYASRQMNNSGYRLNYNLYTDSALTQIWGNGASGTSHVSDGYTLNLFSQSRNYTVYGQIPALQVVAPGAYTDTLQVTVTF